MGIKRIVDTSFWNDEKIIEYFTPEDKLFFLYLLTNPHSTQLGIYSITQKHMAFEIGYSQDTIEALIDRFENTYKVIRFSRKTKEVAIKNYLKYSIVKGGRPVEDCLIKEISLVKDKSLLKFVYNNIIDYENLNSTVKKIIEEFNNNYNDYENDNDNEVSYHDSYHDSYDDTLKKTKETFVSVIESYTENEELKEVLNDFVEMRKKVKGFTIRALKLNLNELDKLAVDDLTKIDIVNQSVMKGWKSFYALKSNARDLAF